MIRPNQTLGYAPSYTTSLPNTYPMAMNAPDATQPYDYTNPYNNADMNNGQMNYLGVGGQSALGIAAPVTSSIPPPMNVQQTNVPQVTNPAQLPPVTLPTNYANPQQINQGGIAAPPTGLIGSELALQGGFNGALNSMDYGAAGAEQILGQTAQQGQTAANMQSALTDPNSGASFYQSPAAKYQMEQMQRAVERSAAARGGLLGGNTLLELQRNAAGIASQDAQNQFNNFGAVADRGTQLQAKIADLRNNLGLNKGQLFTQTGSELAAGRTNAGLAIAQNVSNTASGISNLLNQQGIKISENMSQDIGTISNLLHEAGMGDKVDNANLAQILANISGGQASNIQQGYQNIGNAQAAGIMGTNAAVQNGMQQAVQLGAFTPKQTYNYQAPASSPSTFTAGGTTYQTNPNFTLGGSAP